MILALVPIAVLVATIVIVITSNGAGAIASAGPWALLSASGVAVAVAGLRGRLSVSTLVAGLRSSASQLLPAIPVLVCIGLIASSWMLGGIVPLMIDSGLRLISAELFLPVACGVCAMVSVLLGSSWTTIATVGLAFMGIGSALGYSEPWIAGAVISGAYFGDKISPLSDTTVVASSSCGVDLFTHIRGLLATTVPAMVCALTVFAVVSLSRTAPPVSHSAEIADGLREMFNLSPWLLTVPAVTVAMCIARVKAPVVLLISGIMGLVAMFVFQPGIVASLGETGTLRTALRVAFLSTEPAADSPLLAPLVATSGILGMVPTIVLVMSAGVFGGTLIGTGTLDTITHALTSRLRRRSSLVASTAATGLALNACTGDQYLSLIIGSNIYRNAYSAAGHPPRLLSRTLEDSVSVTSVLIPWNSCGITQSTVLGVATLAYLPCCVFNYLSPIITLLLSHRRR